MKSRSIRPTLAVLTAAGFSLILRAGDGEALLRHAPGGGPPVRVEGDHAKLERKEADAVQLTDLPAAAQQALRDHAQGATLERIIRPPRFYVIGLSLEGESKSLWVSEEATHYEGPGTADPERLQRSGSVLPWSELPQAVRDFVSSRYPGAPLLEVRRMNATYEALLDRQGRKSWVSVSEDGRLLDRTERRKPHAAGPEHRAAAEGQPQSHEQPSGNAPLHREHVLKEQP